MLLNGKRVLVTGASSGIGRATCIYLAKFGVDVVLCGRNDKRLKETMDLMSQGNHELAPLDLSKHLNDIPAWVKSLAEKPFDGLVHSAGIEKTLPVRQTDQVTFDNILKINTQAALMLVRGISQKKCHALSSSVVFISSVASLSGRPGLSMYSASKGALNAMAKALAAELARKKIRVNTVCPGQVKTEMDEAVRMKIGQDRYQKIIDAHPLGLGEPEDVAGAVAFLLSDAARWITGTSLIVDGGYTAL